MASELMKELDNLRSLEQPSYSILEKTEKGREIRALWMGYLALSGRYIPDHEACEVLFDELCNCCVNVGLDISDLIDRFKMNEEL